MELNLPYPRPGKLGALQRMTMPITFLTKDIGLVRSLLIESTAVIDARCLRTRTGLVS